MNENDFKNWLEYGKRLTEIDDQPIQVTQLPFCYIKWEFADLMQKNIINTVKIALDHLNINYKSLSGKELSCVFLYLYDEIMTKEGVIYQLEETYLKGTPDPNMIAAGQNRLAPYNNLLTLFNLSNKDVLKIEEVSKMPYQMLLDIQSMQKIEGEIQSNYHKIISKKK